MKEVSSILISTLFFRLDGLFSEYSTLYAVTPLDILVGGCHCKVMVVFVAEISFNSRTVFVPAISYDNAAVDANINVYQINHGSLPPWQHVSFIFTIVRIIEMIALIMVAAPPTTPPINACSAESKCVPGIPACMLLS